MFPQQVFLQESPQQVFRLQVFHLQVFLLRVFPPPECLLPAHPQRAALQEQLPPGQALQPEALPQAEFPLPVPQVLRLQVLRLQVPLQSLPLGALPVQRPEVPICYFRQFHWILLARLQ